PAAPRAERRRAPAPRPERAGAGAVPAQLLHLQRPLSRRRRAALRGRSDRGRRPPRRGRVARRHGGGGGRARAHAPQAAGARGALPPDPVLVLARLGVRELRARDDHRGVGARLRRPRGRAALARQPRRAGGPRLALRVRARTRDADPLRLGGCARARTVVARAAPLARAAPPPPPRAPAPAP